MLPLVVAATVLAALAWRWRYVRNVEHRSLLNRTFGPDGIVVGGAGFELTRDASAPAILLLHGAGDTPQTLRYLGQSLFDRGFAISAPLLPGHGRTLRDFARVTAAGLIDAARAHYRALCERHAWVGVIGVSMGGALAVQLASENDLPALGLVAPYLAMPSRIARAARWARLWGMVMPFVQSSEGLSILDPAERDRSLAYGAFAANALHALALTLARSVAALPRVKAPTLMIQSRADNRISPDAAERVFARLGAREKRLEWISGAAHVITVDYGREHVFELLGLWMETHRAMPADR